MKNRPNTPTIKMSKRQRKVGVTNKMVAYIAAGVVHAAIIGAMLFNFTSKPKTVIEAFDADKVDIMNATTIEESQIKDQQDLLKKKEAEKKRREEQEKKRLEDLQKQAKDEKKKIEELKEQQREEKEKAQELEAERKKIALEKKEEDKKRAKEEAERKKKEAERKKKEEAEKERKEKVAREKKAADDKKRAEDEAAKKRLDDLLAEEEQRVSAQNTDRIAKERTATISSKYAALIREAVNQKRTISPDFERWRVAEINIKLSPRGDVLGVRTVKSSGSSRYDRDAETAIRKASPLPIPSEQEDAQAHQIFRDVTLKFSMPGAN